MKNKLNKIKLRLVLTLLLFAVNGVSQTPPQPGGGVGRTTPGAPASPIDDYIFLLLPLAVVLITFFANKYRKQLN